MNNGWDDNRNQPAQAKAKKHLGVGKEEEPSPDGIRRVATNPARLRPQPREVIGITIKIKRKNRG
jgi:hypothetical protein